MKLESPEKHISKVSVVKNLRDGLGRKCTIPMLKQIGSKRRFATCCGTRKANCEYRLVKLVGSQIARYRDNAQLYISMFVSCNVNIEKYITNFLPVEMGGAM